MDAPCCARGCDDFFDERMARRDARRYRRKGLDRTGRRIVAFLRERRVGDLTVLEIGGGVGAVQVELLRAGARRATNVELSPAYETTARELLAAATLDGRADRFIADVAADGAEVGPADAVILHRVVCCYPDFEALLGAAAERTRRVLVFSYPRRNALSRLVIGVQGLWFRARGTEFRTFAHKPDAMLAALTLRGLRPVLEHRGLVWRVSALERP